ncbi:MAG: 50S ribosomal protein L17 [Actinomycetota bacterium]
MARPTRGPRLGGGPDAEKAIMRGLSRALILHGRVVTTETKAKRVRPYVEKLITKGRKGGLHNRRLVLAELQDRKLVHRLFEDVAPRAGDRPGGYTRIMKLGPRRGDAAPMAILELVDAPKASAAPIVIEEPKRMRDRLRRRREKRKPEPVLHDHDHDHDHDHEEPVAEAEIEAEAVEEVTADADPSVAEAAPEAEVAPDTDAAAPDGEPTAESPGEAPEKDASE